jgi:hypothetical protein
MRKKAISGEMQMSQRKLNAANFVQEKEKESGAGGN